MNAPSAVLSGRHDPALTTSATATPLRIGVTGHINLARRSRALVLAALRAELRRHGDRPVHGITCLAEGTDQLFARALLAEGGTYEVVLPAADYAGTQIAPHNRAAFDRLLRSARRVTYAYPYSCERAFAAANDELLRRSDRLIAVWDGSPGEIGGTAAAVTAAHDHRLPVEIIWPKRARREPAGAPAPARRSTSDGDPGDTDGY